jgi:hypothetical protein
MVSSRKKTNKKQNKTKKIEINMENFKNMSDKDKDFFVDKIFFLLNHNLGYDAYRRWGNIYEEYDYISKKIQDYLARKPDAFYNTKFIQFVHDNFFYTITT